MSVRRGGRFVACGLIAAGLGLAWPLDAAPTRGSNVQIGSDSDVEMVRLDWDRDDGDLFAITLHDDGDWTLYRSTDAGASWVSKYHWLGTASLVDLVVAGDWVYIAYVVPPDVRVRRASKSTGEIDTTFDTNGWALWVDDAPSTIEEIAMTSNPEDNDLLIYLATLHVDDSLSAYYANPDSGDVAVPVPPGVSDAESGLDLAWHVGFPLRASSDAFLYLSYVGNDQKVWVYRRGPGGGEGDWDVGTAVEGADGFARSTGIAAFEDNVMVAFESEGSGAYDVRYRVAYDGGDSGSWLAGSVATGSGDSHYVTPIVSARSGTGFGILMQHENGPVDEIVYRERMSYPYTPFTAAARISDEQFYTGHLGFDFEWMGHGWALAYVSGSGEVWFGWTQSVRWSGFEHSGLDEWSDEVGGP